jgi:hypothetical protein
MPSADAIQTLAVEWRGRNTFNRASVPNKNTAVEILDISAGQSGDMISGSYPLVMTKVGPKYQFTYNGIDFNIDGISTTLAWTPNLVGAIDGGDAGIITFSLVSGIAPVNNFTENISINQ